MIISDKVILACRTTADFIEPLRRVFRAGDYAGVFDSIARFHELATANRGQARRRLFESVKAFVSNYVISGALGAADMLDWESAFPDLLEELGHPREDEWRVFLLDHAEFTRDGLRDAIEVILQSITRFRAR